MDLVLVLLSALSLMIFALFMTVGGGFKNGYTVLWLFLSIFSITFSVLLLRQPNQVEIFTHKCEKIGELPFSPPIVLVFSEPTYIAKVNFGKPWCIRSQDKYYIDTDQERLKLNIQKDLKQQKDLTEVRWNEIETVEKVQ